MAFKYGTTSPTAIKYNGTDLTVLKYGTTAVWGKPYSLSISAGANTSVSVTRNSSPNQGASTGTLSSGSVVYYGDVLTITASASSGYNLSTFTVNGSNFTSGNTITVTSAVSVVTTAISSASWHTVWTGNSTQNFNSSVSSPNEYLKAPSTSLMANVPTRITGRVQWFYAGYYDYDNAVETSELPITLTESAYSRGVATITLKSVTLIGSGGQYIPYFVCTRTFGDFYGDVIGCGAFQFTKIEQYY